MKRADNILTAIKEIKKLYNIKNPCESVHQLLENLHVANKELESLTINLMIDKYQYNKYFTIDRKSFAECRQEVKDFLE